VVATTWSEAIRLFVSAGRRFARKPVDTHRWVRLCSASSNIQPSPGQECSCCRVWKHRACRRPFAREFLGCPEQRQLLCKRTPRTLRYKGGWISKSFRIIPLVDLASGLNGTLARQIDVKPCDALW